VTGRVRFLLPLRIRDFRLLWTGMTISLLGDGVLLVAFAWQVYELSNSPAALALVGFAMTLPQVAFLLLGGVLSDRLDRRRVMIASDLVRALAIAAVAAMSLSGTLTLGWMVGLVSLYGAATAFFGPAFDAIVPDLVPAERLIQANSLDQFVRPAALRLAGPALGGVLVAAAGTGPAFVLDAATFALSAGCVLAIRPRAATASAEASSRSPLRDVWEGFSFVRSHLWLWGSFLGGTISYLLFIGPTEVLLPYVVKNDIGGGAQALGAVFAVGGVGAIAAAVITGQLGMPRRHMTLMWLAWSVGTFSIAGYGLAVATWQLMVASLIFNALETAGTVWWATTKQRVVPRALLGRVSSLDWFISIGLVPLSYALVAPIAAAAGAGPTLVGAGLIGGVTTLLFLFLPGMRDVERAGLAADDRPHEAGGMLVALPTTDPAT
jgi:MFS family permease